MRFDKKRREFYAELNDVINETSLTETDLRDKFGDDYEKVIERDISQIVNRFLRYFYTGKNQTAHQLMVLYLLLTDEDKQEGFKRAILEQVKAAYYSGMDLNQYQEEQKENIPHSVYHELVNADLYRPGEIHLHKDSLEKLKTQVDALIAGL